MPADSADIWPDHWLRPEPVRQRSLFPLARDEHLTLARISADEVRRWHNRGWISFDIDDVESFDVPQFWELCFVRNIARSGLADEQIECLFQKLPKPYRFDPQRIAYSFALGWVVQPETNGEYGLDQMMEEHLSQWLSSLVASGDLDRLQQVKEEVFDRLADYVIAQSNETKDA